MAKDTQQSSSSKTGDAKKNNNLANLYSRKDENYITIFGWMTNRLKLSGNELLVYALIFSFAKDGASEFHGSTEYIAKTLNMGRRTVFTTLRSLAKKEVIRKRPAGRYCNYSIPPMPNLHTTYADSAQVSMPNQHSIYADSAHHIKSISKDDSSSGIQKQTTTTFINACKKIGFSLDKKKAAEILSIGIDLSWLSGLFTYPEFIAEYIQGAYQDKPQQEKRKLFMALLAKEDKRDEYPEWRKTKEAEAVAQEKLRQREADAQDRRRRIDQARANKPKACGHCGIALSPENEHGTCPSCGFEFFFDEISEVYTFQKPKESLTAQFSRHMTNRGKGQSAATE